MNGCNSNPLIDTQTRPWGHNWRSDSASVAKSLDPNSLRDNHQNRIFSLLLSYKSI